LAGLLHARADKALERSLLRHEWCIPFAAAAPRLTPATPHRERAYHSPAPRRLEATFAPVAPAAGAPNSRVRREAAPSPDHKHRADGSTRATARAPRRRAERP